MDRKNENISETFGKYNSGYEVKNVSSSMWQPISAGRSDEAQASVQPPQNRGQNAPADKKKAKAPAGKSFTDDLISQGNPAGRAAAEKKANSRKADKSKDASSRTPKGRDLRRNAREQRKHRQERCKIRGNYNDGLQQSQNHDEISHRINKKKRHKYVLRTGAKVALVIILAVIAIIGYILCRGALIEAVVIEGNSVYTEEEIQQVAGIRTGKSMFLLSEARVRRVLTKKLPYIKEVELERDYRHTVTLSLVTTTDRYVISGQSGSFTIDADRKVISESAVEAKAGVYFVEGLDYQQCKNGDTYEPEGANIEKFALFERFVNLFEKSGVVESAVIDLGNMEDVRVIVDGKIAVYFGDCRSLEEKIPYASAIIVEVRKAGKTGYLDMTTQYGYFSPGSMTIG